MITSSLSEQWHCQQHMGHSCGIQSAAAELCMYCKNGMMLQTTALLRIMMLLDSRTLP
jgi:hypothetical protein